jgi:hypothetical protein
MKTPRIPERPDFPSAAHGISAIRLIQERSAYEDG